MSWLLREIDEDTPCQSILAPHPLRTRVIAPTLSEWIEAEPENAEPHRWIGGQDHWRRAIELDPDDQIARRKLVASILNGVDYATHEMPTGYLGSPLDDWQALAEAEVLLKGLANENIRQALLSELVDIRLVVETALPKRNASFGGLPLSVQT